MNNGVVTELWAAINPEKRTFPDEVGIDVKNFKKIEIRDNPGYFTYEAEQLGLDLDLDDEGKISDVIIYSLPEKEHLKCTRSADVNGKQGNR